jgi:hypothetical protein
MGSHLIMVGHTCGYPTHIDSCLKVSLTLCNYAILDSRDCTKLLVNFHSSAADSKLKAVHRKYSNPLRGAVALLPPSSKFLKESKDAAST